MKDEGRHTDPPEALAGHATSIILKDGGARPTMAVPPERFEAFIAPNRTPHAVELNHFDVLETVGKGGFGVVVKALDRKLARVVAIKLMSAEMAATSPARKRFLREARAAAAVRHDNVVHIYAVEEHPTPHLVMEYVPGGSLQQLLDRTGPLDVAEVLRIGAQVARGLAAAHALGLVHRDVKPANVMLEDGPHPQVKLTDFGLARAADDASLTQSGMVLGTPMYMAPEQARGEALDHRADLFSLGSVLYVMACGRAPFRAANSLAVLKRVADESPRPIGEIIPEAPAWVCDIIGRLHARNPGDRFQSADEVADLLERCRAELSKGVSIRVPRRRKWRRWAAPAAALLAVAAVAAGFATYPRAERVAQADPAPQPPAEPVPPTPPPTPAPRPKVDFTNSIGMEFVRVPAGKSMLGGGGGVPGARPVEFTRDFFIGRFEVTHEEWDRVLGPARNPSDYTPGGPRFHAVQDVPTAVLKRFPVDALEWNDCQVFIRELNRLEKDSGWVYRLPLADEWEYACRNGPGQSLRDLACDFYAGEPSSVLDPTRMNVAATGQSRPRPVGSYPPNRLGIHDMQGNVFEYLDDLCGANGEARALAGGMWNDQPDNVRAAPRGTMFPHLRTPGAGLRLVRVPADAPPTPRQQLDTLDAELRRLNPTWKGRLGTTFADGRLVGLVINEATPIKDLAPLRFLRDLRSLTAWNTAVTDLSPLLGLPLRELGLNNAPGIRDLSPLAGMPLEKLEVWGYGGADLSPLRGMKLRHLLCGGGGQILDLSPLKGMRLNYLCVNHTPVDDLSPLEGMPLEVLLAEHTRLADLSPLRGMRLRQVALDGSPVADPGLLRGMPLEELTGNFEFARDAEFLRSFSGLKTINAKPAAEFWKSFEKK